MKRFSLHTWDFSVWNGIQPRKFTLLSSKGLRGILKCSAAFSSKALNWPSISPSLRLISARLMDCPGTGVSSISTAPAICRASSSLSVTGGQVAQTATIPLFGTQELKFKSDAVGGTTLYIFDAKLDAEQ